ncbi:MAG TPA: GNAT family N-acetyltransferase [Bacillales bacterium]|nr:GNAT family N-acetyltransferase [Bacillales bacterium]
MIRRLNVEDHDEVMNLLVPEAAFNLFIIGDIENNGYEEDFQELWGDFSEKGELRAVLLRYYDGFVVYAKGEWDKEAFSIKIKEFPEAVLLQGKKEVIEGLEKAGGFVFQKKRRMHFAELKDGRCLDVVGKTVSVKKAGANHHDVDRLIRLRGQIPEFSPLASDVGERMIRNFKTGSGRAMFIEEEGEVVACASTTAENNYSAMVVGGATQNAFRRKGYASICMSALCHEVLQEGKTLCLFYDNPHAGNIYKRLGFQDIGMWNMYRF